MRRALIAMAALLLLAAQARSEDAPKADPGTPQIMVPDDGGPVAPRRVRRGSSSPSPVPPYQSTVTPLGVAPGVIETRRPAPPPSLPTIVPGQYGTVGPVYAPARVPGQTFQDRAAGCVHAGSAQGIGPGEIGAFTGGCVNR